MAETVKIVSPYLAGGKMVRGHIEYAFKLLKRNGCTVEWSDVKRRQGGTTWYDVEIEGPEVLVREFQAWAEAMQNGEMNG
jgi:hypothetical protein